MADLTLDEPDEATETQPTQAEADKLATFLRAFDTAAAPQQENRALALQARRFVHIPGAQWEGAGWDEFSENMIRVQVNKTKKGLKKIINDYKANRVTVDFRPVSDTDDETAETLDGRFRADTYRSRAGSAFDNAFEEGTSGGLGAWRLCNEDEDPYDPDNDYQVINFEPIVDADQSVFFDPNSKHYDKSDAQWGCVITAVARQAFVDEWGEGHATNWPKDTWRPFFDWFMPDIVRICEWYQVEEKTERRWTLTNAVTGEELKVWASDVEKDWLNEQLAGGWTQRGRDIKRKRVHKYTLSGAEILKDNGLIAGSEIPIITYYGERRFIDNQERFNGHVQDAMDPQRIYNSQVSRLVETAARSPYETPIVTPEQMGNHGDDWARLGKDRLPFVYLDPITDENGNKVSQGPIGTITPSQVDPVAAALLQITAGDIAELTDSEDGADEVVSNVSHEAMDLAATRTDEKSSGYMDNFKLSMEWCGRVYLSMFKETYVEEGRKIETRGLDGEEGTATLVQSKVDDTGRYLTINDFSRGKWNVVADVTESSATKRDKTVRKSLGLAQIAGPESPLGQAALVTAVSSMDGEGIEGLKKVARKQGLSLGVFDPTDQEKQEAAQAQQEQPPAPADQALVATARKLISEAGLNDAKAQTEQAKGMESIADAHLKVAQATALGGPDQVPQTPTGLTPVDPAKQVDQIASAKLKSAQADKISHDIGLAHADHGLQRIKTGHQIAMEQAAHDLAIRQQDHAESIPANDKAAA